MPIFPPWQEFVDKSAEAQTALDRATTRFMLNEPLLRREIDLALDILPKPLNFVAKIVWRKSDGSDAQKASDVAYYLKHLQRQGWSHYQSVTGSLESLLASAENKEKFLELESLLSRIQLVLISSGGDLNTHLAELKLEVGRWNAKQDKLLGAVGKILLTIDRTAAAVTEAVGLEPLPVYSELLGESIVVKDGDQHVAELTTHALHSRLTPQQKQMAIQLERSVSFNYEVLMKSRAQYPGEPDPDARVQLRAIMQQALAHLCEDWKTLLQYVDFRAPTLAKAYSRHIEICQTQSASSLPAR